MLDSDVPQSAAIHALTAGAIGTMILAVMTRVMRGHTGRVLSADRATVVIYILVNIAALARVAAAVGETWTTPAAYRVGKPMDWGLCAFRHILRADGASSTADQLVSLAYSRCLSKTPEGLSHSETAPSEVKDGFPQRPIRSPVDQWPERGNLSGCHRRG